MAIRTIKPRESVRTDGSSVWFFRMRIEGIQRKFTYASERAALEALYKMQTEINQKTFIAPNTKTVRALAEEWSASKCEKRESTQRHYQDALRPLLEAHGDLPVQKLTSGHLEALKTSMKSGNARRVGTPGQPLSARTINGTLQATRAMLKFGMRKRYVQANEAELVDFVPSKSVKRGALEPKEAKQFLAHVREHDGWHYGAWVLALHGLRRGEILGLRWIDVDLDGSQARKGNRNLVDGTPSIQICETRMVIAGRVTGGDPKTKDSARVLPIEPELVAVLQAMKDLQTLRQMELAADGVWQDTGLVVVDRFGGAVHPNRFSEAWLSHLAIAGLPRMPLHCARHTAASLAGAEGLPIVNVAAWLGQKQTSVTASYQHAATPGKIDVGKAFVRILGI